MTKEQLNSKLDKLETKFLEVGYGDVLAALRQGNRIFIFDQNSIGNELLDNQLWTIGALVKLCSRHNATVMFVNHEFVVRLPAK